MVARKDGDRSNRRGRSSLMLPCYCYAAATRAVDPLGSRSARNPRRVDFQGLFSPERVASLMGHEDPWWVADSVCGAIRIHGPTAHGAGLPAAWVVAVDPVERG
jgi:hypothetical protein